MRTTPRTIAIPREFMRASAAKPPPTPPADTGIYLSALCAREFGATFCQLLLASRLGGDVFYAGCLVTLYVNVVFRRPMALAAGCLLALVYEWALVRMDPCGDGTMCRADGTVSWGANLLHKMLYFSPVPARGW